MDNTPNPIRHMLMRPQPRSNGSPCYQFRECARIVVLRLVWLCAVFQLLMTAPQLGIGAGPTRDKEGEEPLRDHLESQGYTCIPLSRLKAGYLVATVRVRALRPRSHLESYFYAPDRVLSDALKPEEATFCLLVDSGSPNSYFDLDRTKSLQILWIPTSIAAYDYCRVEWIRLGPIDSGEIGVYSDDLSDTNSVLADYGDPPVDGLLGGDILNLSSAVIDYENAHLFVKPKADRQSPPGLLQNVDAGSGARSISAKRDITPPSFHGRRFRFRRSVH